MEIAVPASPYTFRIHSNAVSLADANQDRILPRESPIVGFMRHSPPQVMPDQFDKLRQWRSHLGPGGCCNDGRDGDLLKHQAIQLPRGSPYVGSYRHAPPSPILCFKPKKSEICEDLTGPFKLPISALEDERCRYASSAAAENLPEEAWLLILSLVAEVHNISSLSLVTRRISSLLKSELVWAQRRVQILPASIKDLAPQLDSWLAAWRLASKLVIPRSKQLMAKVSKQMPDLPLEVAWRFDTELKGKGVEVVNHGRSVRRVPGAEDELVVLGDAPLPQTVAGDSSVFSELPYLEIVLDDRSATDSGDGLNDFGVGVTARLPSKREVGAVADEVPLSWVVDFTQSSVVLSVNNQEGAKGYGVTSEDLQAGDRVGVRVPKDGSVEVYINGELRDHLIPNAGERVPQGVELFPVVDLYGCTVQLSRTDADRPC